MSEAIELELVQVCRELGGIAGSNRGFTSGLAALIEKGGKPLDAMSIGELLAMLEQHQAFYNKIYGGEVEP